jgi:hypothetical protein
MRAKRKFATPALATALLALMTSEVALAASIASTRSTASAPTAVVATDLGSGRGTVVLPNVIYDARPSSTGFGRRTYLFSTPGTRTVTHPKPVINDHRKGSNSGSSTYPPAGTPSTSIPPSGNTVRDHRGEPHPYTVTESKEYIQGNPNPRTVKTFRTGTGMTVTVKSHPKPVCIGNACWLPF